MTALILPVQPPRANAGSERVIATVSSETAITCLTRRTITVAWERPDAFRRVMSFVGSFANLRGRDMYANLIRKMEPKPLRVFLQHGANDQNIYGGSWYLANQAMAKSLAQALPRPRNPHAQAKLPSWREPLPTGAAGSE